MRRRAFWRSHAAAFAGRGAVRSVVLSGESAGAACSVSVHREGRAGALLALDRDVASHQLREAAHDREAEARAAEAARGRGIGLRERLEQARALLFGEPDAGVGDRDRDLRSAVAERLGAGMQRDAAALGELDRVAEQVEQHLPHARRIADQRVVGAGIDLDVEREALR